MLWIIVPLLVAAVVAGIDYSRNPESWRELGLMIQDVCRYVWFYPRTVQMWVERLKKAYRHSPRHCQQKMPAFMSTWHLL